MSSLVSDFWNLLFFPMIRISLIILLIRLVFGRDRFDRLKLKLFENIARYSKKIKYRERLGKAVPIVSMFLLFSFLYLFSIFYSTVESFISLNISFDDEGYLSSDTVLNVWRYHPYIEDFSTLQRVVYYKAEESEFGTVKLLSTEGLRNLPEILLRSSIVFVVILLSCLIILLFIKMTKRDIIKRLIMIFRAALALLILISLFIGISFLKHSYANNYTTQAWNQYELQLLSSGAPPESDVDIKKEKLDEVTEYIDNHCCDFHVYVSFGPMEISITYADHEFHVIHYH